ncbi:ATP-binding protein [Glutamicibacter bergerei]
MSRLDGESNWKLREMNSGELLEAIDSQDEILSIGMPLEERVRLVVDDAYDRITRSKVEGLIRRAGPRYPNADPRRIDLLDERSLNRELLTQLGTCSFDNRQQNVVFQGFTGLGKSYLGFAIAKRACENRIRAHHVRMPDLEEAWVAAQDRPGGSGKFLRKYASFTMLVVEESLLDRPTESMRGMLMERRYGETSTVFYTQYSQKDWHQRLGSGVRADAIMDRMIYNTIWVEAGTYIMREHTALAGA